MSIKERNKLIEGLKLAEYRTLRRKAMHNEYVVHSDTQGKTMLVSAREVYTQLYNEPVPTF